MLNFFIPGIPKPQARARTFFRPGAKFPVTWSPKTNWSGACYRKALENRPRKPLDVPLGVELKIYLPRPKSAAKVVFRPAVRPDLDNYEKAILDALTRAGIWADDGRICELHSHKLYEAEGLPAGCGVMVWELST